MLGNPPWERIKLQEEEFFATRSPLVATARNKHERGQRIELLRQGMLLHTLFPDVEAAEGLCPPNKAEMGLYEAFLSARRGAEAASLFAHESRRYPLMGLGDVNTFALFAETFLQLISQEGRAGFVSPTGIATDDTTKGYFSELVKSQRLVSLLSFYEVRRWFPGTDDRKPFCLFTIGKSDSALFIYDVETLADFNKPEKWYELTKSDFEQINPNTKTLPIFRSQRDAELTKKLYGAAPVLIKEGCSEPNGNVSPALNLWGIHFYTMFHMSNDSGLFRAEPAQQGQPIRLPLYEAKMIHQFDHRWATYIDAPDKPDGLDTEDCSVAQKADPNYAVRPRYWIEEREVLARIARVPSRVATAWLATHAPQSSEPLKPEKTLEAAVATWVAGELFRREAGTPDCQNSWPDSVLLKAYQASEKQLELRFYELAQALRSIGVTGKKALGEFVRWARLDSGVALNDKDLADLDDLCLRWRSLSNAASRTQLLLEVADEWMDVRSPKWLMGWRDICRSTDCRTLISSVLPRSGVGHKFLLLSSNAPSRKIAAFLGCINSMTCDYIVRQKVGGTSLTYFTMKQLAVLSPECFSEADLEFIVPRVLELTYTSNELKPWAEDLGYMGAPFSWNQKRRAQLRAELDVYYAKLYGLTLEELRYILDPADVMGEDYPSETFRVLKNNEMREFREYRTQRLVLEAWDTLTPGQLETTTVPGFDAQNYSELAVIGGPDDASLAGLVAAIIRQSAAGISVVDIQAAVALGRIADRYLDSSAAVRLAELADNVAALGDNELLRRIPAFVQRLEAGRAVTRRRSGPMSCFVIGPEPLPKDIGFELMHDELAQLLLTSQARRAVALAEEDAGTHHAPKAQGQN